MHFLCAESRLFTKFIGYLHVLAPPHFPIKEVGFADSDVVHFFETYHLTNKLHRVTLIGLVMSALVLYRTRDISSAVFWVGYAVGDVIGRNQLHRIGYAVQP